MRLTTLYFGPNQSQRVKPVNLLLDQAETLSVDLSAYCGVEAVLIDSAIWGVIDSDPSVSVGTATTGTKVTSAIVTAADTGKAKVQVSVAMTNGEVIIFIFRVVVTDPQYASTPIDRYCA